MASFMYEQLLHREFIQVLSNPEPDFRNEVVTALSFCLSNSDSIHVRVPQKELVLRAKADALDGELVPIAIKGRAGCSELLIAPLKSPAAKLVAINYVRLLQLASFEALLAVAHRVLVHRLYRMDTPQTRHGSSSPVGSQALAMLRQVTLAADKHIKTVAISAWQAPNTPPCLEKRGGQDFGEGSSSPESSEIRL